MTNQKISLLGIVAAAFVMGAPPLQAKEPVVAQVSCDAGSLDSVPGQKWNAGHGWRFNTSTNPDPKKRAEENLANRQAAYTKLVTGQSPWPSWFEQSISITLLQPGALFQMAMGPENLQPDNRPGGFGTFDEIRSVAEVREDLAVIKAWKPDVARVNLYRVKEVLPVKVGPIGPQVDPGTCKLLPGRFSQFQMLVTPPQRMHYIEFVSSHPID